MGFQIKQYPNGTINKLKAHLCMHGDQQIEDVNVFDTYAPVMNFFMAYLMLIMSIRLGCASNQINYTAAFAHAAVDEEIYVDMLQEYKQEDKVICLVYVDDRLFFATRQSNTDDLVDKIQAEEMVFNIENNTTVSSEVAPIGKDLIGKEENTAFNYLCMIGMMLYQSCHSQPDIQYTESQCACFSSNPKASHIVVLKTIGKYLKGTQDKSLVTSKAANGFDIDYHVGANFTGLWTSKVPDDPDCARSCTDFVITLCVCPIIWASKLQKEQSSSTMEAEYIALSTAMKELLKFQFLVKEIVGKFKL
eukprot:15348130-Ditylum_brightwellii.AAC.2